MKRRLKLTPFAKIIFVIIIIAAARYVYVNQEKISNGKFFNFQDTLTVFGNEADTLNETIRSDTVVFYISGQDSIITLTVNNKEINIPNTSKLNADTLIFKISDKKNLTGKVIVDF